MIRPRLPGLGAALAAAVVLTSCAGLPRPFDIGATSMVGPTEEELRERLIDFARRVSARVESASAEIAAQTDARAVRRRALLWKIRVVPLVREAALLEDPQEGYVAVYAIVVAIRQYVTVGDGRQAFVEQQQIVVRAARALEADIRELGASFLDSEQLERVAHQVEDLAGAHPIRGSDLAVDELHGTLREVEESARFSWITALPMLPYRTLEGVSSTAGSVREFNETAQEFTEVVKHLPQQIAWMIELLLYDLEDRETLLTLREEFARLSQSAERASLAVDGLPEELRVALADSEAALGEANRALASARDLVEPLGSVVEEVRLAGVEWGALVAREPDPDARTFDVREWESAAREIGQSAAELRDLAAQIQALTASDGLTPAVEPVRSVVDHADARAHGLVAAASWRAAGLIVLFFVLLLLYRVLSARVGRPRA